LTASALIKGGVSVVEKSTGELPVCHSEGQCCGDVFQAPGWAVNDVSYNGGSQLRHARRCYSCCQEWVCISVFLWTQLCNKNFSWNKQNVHTVHADMCCSSFIL